MNKKNIFLALLASFALASCGESGTSTFYGKTYTYQSDACYGLNATSSGACLGDVIKENFSSNIDWDKTGFVGLLSVTPFSSHTDYDNMCTSMVSSARSVFDIAYGGLNLVVNDYKTKTAVVTYKGETHTYALKGSADDDTEEASTVYMYETSDTSYESSVGSLSWALYAGSGCINGKWTCIQFEYAGITNKTQCIVTFKNAVTWRGQSTTSITWDVYAKIAN